MSSIGFGAYGDFGYTDEPQWGLFNPAQSLFKSDPTLYDSLFATNQDANKKDAPARSPRRKRHQSLPSQVGPRKAFQRNAKPQNSLGGWVGEEPADATTATKTAPVRTTTAPAISPLLIVAGLGLVWFLCCRKHQDTSVATTARRTK